MTQKNVDELVRIYLKSKKYVLTEAEKQKLKTFKSLEIQDKKYFSESVNESVDDIEIYIEQDIKRS